MTPRTCQACPEAIPSTMWRNSTAPPSKPVAMQQVFVFTRMQFAPTRARSTPLTIARLLHGPIYLERQGQRGRQGALEPWGCQGSLLHAYCTPTAQHVWAIRAGCSPPDRIQGLEDRIVNAV